MTDHVIDTNVFVVASAAESTSRTTTHIDPYEALKVHGWVASFRADVDSSLVLDEDWVIWREYTDNLDEQEFGFIVAREMLADDQVGFIGISLDSDGYGVLPGGLMTTIHDRKDRKFIAVVLADELRSSIVNATDSDWASWAATLATYGVVVLQLLD